MLLCAMLFEANIHIMRIKSMICVLKVKFILFELAWGSYLLNSKIKPLSF